MDLYDSPLGDGAFRISPGPKILMFINGAGFHSLTVCGQSLFSLGLSFSFCEMRRADEPRVSKDLPVPVTTASGTWFGTTLTPHEGRGREWGKGKVECDGPPSPVLGLCSRITVGTAASRALTVHGALCLAFNMQHYVFLIILTSP